MKDAANSTVELSRRAFLKGAALAGAAAAGSTVLTGCAADDSAGDAGVTEEGGTNASSIIDPTHVEDVGYDWINTENTKPIAPVAEPEAWDAEADVIVVGSGAGGEYATARLAAEGLNVICLEAQNYLNGTSQSAGWCLTYGGVPSIYGTWGRLSDPYDPQVVFDTFQEAYKYSISPDLLMTMINAAPAAYEWLIQEGLDLVDNLTDAGIPAPTYSGCIALKGTTFPEGQSYMTFGSIPGYSQNCKPMCDAIVELAKSKGADFQLSTKVTALVVDDAGRVIGVEADNNGTLKYFKASKAVALICGDFAYNRDMLLQYTPKLGLGAPNAVEVITNDGSCTRMALALGATMTGSNSYSKRDGTIDEGNREVGYRSMYRADEILVRQPWLRFNVGVERMLFKFSGDGSEAETAEVAMTNSEMGTLGHREYVIFDDTWREHIRNFGQKGGRFVLEEDWPWMDDPSRSAPVEHNFDESCEKSIEQGFIKKADTVEELASLLGVDGTKLKALVDGWNKTCAAGTGDPLWGYDAEVMFPIEKGPFYGSKMGASIQAIKTGLKVDTDMRVLNGTGDPIPGLYAGFHTAGGSCGDCCEGDFIFSNVSTSLIGGRMVSDGVLKNEI